MPISLTNTDYRILAFILANKLQNIINDIAGPDQVAYIKNHFIGTKIRLVQDLLNLFNEKNLPSQNVTLVDNHITHEIVIFGCDTDPVLNHLLSIIVYYIYKEWLV